MNEDIQLSELVDTVTLKDMRDRLARMENCLQALMKQKETPVGLAATAIELFGSDSNANKQKVTRAVTDGILREGKEWRDMSAPGSYRCRRAFYVRACKDRLDTPSYKR